MSDIEKVNIKYEITKKMSEVLSVPTEEIVKKDIVKCKRLLKKTSNEVKKYTDFKRVMNSMNRRYAQDYNYRKLSQKRLDKKSLTQVYIDAYNTIMTIREFFTQNNIIYTGAILSDYGQVTGSFTLDRQEFFEKMGFSSSWSNSSNQVFLYVTEPLKAFKKEIENSTNETVNDKINIYQGKKQEVYDYFDNYVRQKHNYQGIGGTIFESFQRMYHVSKLKTDEEETNFLYNIQTEKIKKKKYNLEGYQNYIDNLINFARTGEITKGFQMGDVENQQIKKGKAGLIGSTYLINTLDELYNVFNNFEKGLYSEAEESLLKIFTARLPEIEEYTSEAERLANTTAQESIKKVVQSIKTNLTI